MRQHSCLREETDVIYCYNNVPNNTSIFEHWSVLTVYWQWWFEETWKRHIWIWIKVISAQFPKPLRSILHACRTSPYRHQKSNWFVIFFTITHQTGASFLHFLLHHNFLLVIITAVAPIFRLLTTFEKKGTSVEKTTRYKVRQDVFKF